MPDIDIAILATFSLLWAAIVPTPGANSLLVTHVALTRGPRHLAYVIAGNMAGIALLAVCALLGMAVMLAVFPWLRVAVHVLGGAYLIYFGLVLLRRAARGSPSRRPTRLSTGSSKPDWRTAGLGFATALSNAQAIVFITSVFAIAGILKANLATGLVCIAIMIGMNAAYLGFLGWLFLRPTPRRLYQRFRRAIEGTIGVLFTLFGVRLIVRELVRA